MILTRIAQQQKNKKRYSIYLDNVFAFGVNEATLVHFALHKGQVIEPAEVKLVLAYDQEESLYQQALHYLSYGLRTEQELTRYLSQKLRDKAKLEAEQMDQLNQSTNEPQDEMNEQTVIRSILERLKQLRLIDDLAYSMAYVRTMSQVNRKGPLIIAQSLKQKGLDSHLISQALETYPAEQCIGNAYLLAEKFIKNKKGLPLKLLAGKLQAHLIQKGFGLQDFQAVWDQLALSPNIIEEGASLDQQAQKLWANYQRRYERRQAIQKLKTSLYRKGYSFDLIQQWIDQQIEEV